MRVFDDYAHHPTEVAAILRAARGVVGTGRLVVAFQAHHYYRTADFCAEFGRALALADDVVVMEVYAPGETMVPGGTGTALAAAVPLPPEHVIFEPSWAAVPAHLAARARPGDLVLTMGAGGEVAMLAPEVLEALRQTVRGTRRAAEVRLARRHARTQSRPTRRRHALTDRGDRGLTVPATLRLT